MNPRTSKEIESVISDGCKMFLELTDADLEKYAAHLDRLHIEEIPVQIKSRYLNAVILFRDKIMKIGKETKKTLHSSRGL